MREIRRTTITIEVLWDADGGSDHSYDPGSLAQIEYDIGEGDFIGTWRIEGTEVIAAEDVLDELVAIGNDGSWFGEEFLPMTDAEVRDVADSP